MRNVNWLGLPVAVICSAVSLGLIIDYSSGASDNPWRVALYGAVGVAAVLWEVVGLHRGDHLRRNGRTGTAFICYAGLAMAILITVSYEIGSLAELMESKASVGESRAGERSSLEDERNMLRQQVEKVGIPRPTAAITGEIDAVKAHPRWTSSNGCSNVTAPETKDICTGYGKLTAELGAATAVTVMQARINAINGQLQPLAAAKVADARASYLSKLSGMPEVDARIAVSLLVIAFLLFGRVAGGYVFMDARAEPAEIAPAARAENAPSLQTPREARTAAKAPPAITHGETLPFLPPAGFLAVEDDDFSDDGLTPEEIEALFEIERERDTIDAMNAGRRDVAAAPAQIAPAADPLPEDAEDVARFDPHAIRRRSLVQRFMDDCLVVHGPNSNQRESAKLIRQAYETWSVDMEIGETFTLPIFGRVFEEILVEKGGRRCKNSTIYYEGVSIRPAYADRIARVAAAMVDGDDAASVQVPAPVQSPAMNGHVSDQPRRLGSALRDSRLEVAAGNA